MFALEPVSALHAVQLVAVTVAETTPVAGVTGVLAGVTGVLAGVTGVFAGTIACRRLLVGATTSLTQPVKFKVAWAAIAVKSEVEVARTVASPEAVPTYWTMLLTILVVYLAKLKNLEHSVSKSSVSAAVTVTVLSAKFLAFLLSQAAQAIEALRLRIALKQAEA